VKLSMIRPVLVRVGCLCGLNVSPQPAVYVCAQATRFGAGMAQPFALGFLLLRLSMCARSTRTI
jgi:hypothetical protein